MGLGFRVGMAGVRDEDLQGGGILRLYRLGLRIRV